MPQNAVNKIDLPNDILLGYAGELISQGKEVIMTAKGNSMLPFIRDSKDSVRLTMPVNVGIGDIILAKVPGRGYIMHRVIGLEGDNITMMGDGNIAGTESCTKSDVVGIVTEIIKPDGKGHKPSKGCFWRFLKPFRRYLLFIARRL